MNRRGFFGLVGKLLQVGTAMAVAPEMLAPLKKAVDVVTFEGLSDDDYDYTGEFKVMGKPEFWLAS